MILKLNQVFEFSPQTELVDINLNSSGSDIVFQKGTGRTENNGSFSMRIRNAVEKRIITINSFGNIEWEWTE